ncbi:hypothetical protein HIM_02908 [Hirsutella minnesotensis 3608]|nr:hypothetical protein HIM_02908 [Hirsutella minnesotensis 3608]
MLDDPDPCVLWSWFIDLQDIVWCFGPTAHHHRWAGLQSTRQKASFWVTTLAAQPNAYRPRFPGHWVLMRPPCVDSNEALDMKDDARDTGCVAVA